MSTALDVLQRAESQGIHVWADGTRLLYSPKEAPPAILEELRRHKAELRDLLSNVADRGGVSPHAQNPGKRVGLDGLRARFADGVERLHAQREALDALPDAGVGSAPEAAYCALFAEVIDVEAVMRFVYPDYRGCAKGAVGLCDPLAIVRCQACAEEGSG